MKQKSIQANPQGKGLVPLLKHWQSFEPGRIQEKSAEQLFADYFTSLLVLSADFRFKPVKGVVYFLYFKQPRWHLSLIEPARWSYEQRGKYLGSCQLHEDMTWSINGAYPESTHADIHQALQLFYQQMIRHLDSEKPLIELLPFYLDDLPYYRRMAATGLARSLRHSLAASALLHQPAQKLLISVQSTNDDRFIGE